MPPDTPKKTQLLSVLQEGVALVQMILFKELRTMLGERYADKDTIYLSMLAGAVTNEIFGSQNPEKKFLDFREENKALIEQELLGLAQQLPELKPSITDALRIQALCDNQMGAGSSVDLVKADDLGLLERDREIPLPSTFMTMIRKLGGQHGLVIPPVLITPEEDKIVIH